MFAQYCTNRIIFFVLFLSGLLVFGPSTPTAKQSEKLNHNPAIKRVVVLHSYNDGFSWSDSISDGIRNVFAAQMDEAEIKVEYLDTRFRASSTYLTSVKATLIAKYQDRKVDVVIASDDHALNFMRSYGEEIFTDVPVVFCSVSGFKPEMRRQLKLTGLLESIDIRSTIDTALQLHPDTENIAVILDKSRTGQALKLKTDEALKHISQKTKISYLEGFTVNQLKGKLKVFPQNTVVLLFIFPPDESGRAFSHEVSLKHIRPHSPFPIYAVWQFYLGHGIVGGRLADGYEEGQRAARMAIRILNGESAADIALEKSPIKYMFDYNELVAFDIDLKTLPKGSVLINRPFSFYAQYKMRIWMVSIIFVILLAIIILLVFNVAYRKKV